MSDDRRINHRSCMVKYLIESACSWRAKRFEESLLPGACHVQLDRFQGSNNGRYDRNVLRLWCFVP